MRAAVVVARAAPDEATTLELCQEEMKFSAGHFTILSATERERLHGHNFTVYVAITGVVMLSIDSRVPPLWLALSLIAGIAVTRYTVAGVALIRAGRPA